MSNAIQSFECSNLNCKHRFEVSGRMTMKELYTMMEHAGYVVYRGDGYTMIYCEDCGSQMVYVSVG